MKRIVVVFALIIAVLISSTAFASNNPTVLKFSDVNGEQSIAGTYCKTFKKEVEEKSNGSVIIELYFGGTLSGNNIEGTQMGIADFSQHDVSEVTDLCPMLSILEAPFLFEDEEELFRVTAPDSPILAEINATLAGSGVQLLGTYSWGLQNILTTNTPVYSEVDLAGKKIRVLPSKIFMETMTAMGATATPMSWSEVITSLVTNMIDGTGMPLSNVVSTGLNEIQKYYILTGHNPTLSGIFVNEASFNKLSDEERSILMNASVVAQQAVFAENMAENQKNLQIMKDGGMVIIEPEELKFDKIAIRDSVFKIFEQDWGTAFQHILDYLGKK